MLAASRYFLIGFVACLLVTLALALSHSPYSVWAGVAAAACFSAALLCVMFYAVFDKSQR